MRNARTVSEREIAIALVLELAESGLPRFSLFGYYNDDADFLSSLADRIGVVDDKAFKNKLVRVVRTLVIHGVLYGQMQGTYKEYVEEPTKQMNYRFTRPGKADLLTRGKSDHTGTPEWEASYLLRRAYPEPDHGA